MLRHSGNTTKNRIYKARSSQVAFSKQTGKKVNCKGVGPYVKPLNLQTQEHQEVRPTAWGKEVVFMPNRVQLFIVPLESLLN